MTWTFSLDFPKPLPGLSMNDRVHWRRKNENTQTVRTLTMAAARALHIPVLERARVEVVWIVDNRRKRDTDNLAPLCKAIYDGIGSNKGISARILDDDSPEFMEKPSATIRYEKGATPHFEITITDVGSDQ